jgi:hypothetical protein
MTQVYADSRATLAHDNGVASLTFLPKIERLDVIGSTDQGLQEIPSATDALAYHRLAWFDRIQG